MGGVLDIRLDQVVVERPGFRLEADLAVPSGAAVAVIGPSGSGKTTLLDLVAGFVTPASGTVRLEGRDVTRDGPATRPVSMVFQDNNLFPHLTVAQNVALGLKPVARPDRAALAAAEDALRQVGLEGLGARRPGALSGGQQSRAALARVLLRDRPVLLLDEPFAALGPALRAEMLGLVAKLRAEHGMTLLMVTHTPQDARLIADSVIFVDGGRAQAPRPVAEVLDEPTPEVAAYLGEAGLA